MELLRPEKAVAAWTATVWVVAAAVVVFLAMFFATFRAMAATWLYGTFSHGFLILPIVLYLIWVRRADLVAARPRPTYWLLGPMAVFSLGWLLGWVSDAKVVYECAAVAMLVLLVGTIVGKEIAWKFRFPLAFLLFAVPVGDSLIGPLQDYTAWFVVKALELSRIPVFSEGRMLTVSSGAWEVAQACSGLRYLIASVALGTLYAALVYQRWRRRVLFVLASVLVPIAANGLRAYLIIMIAHLTQRRLAVGIDHLIYGWVFFLVVIAALFGIGYRWREPQACEAAKAPAHPLTSAVRPVSVFGLVGAAIAALITASAGPLYASFIARHAATGTAAIAAPAPTPPWQFSSRYHTDWSPVMVGVDSEVKQAYSLGDRTLDLYVGYYGEQHVGAQLLQIENSAYNEREWGLVSESNRVVQTPTGPLRVYEMRLRPRGGDSSRVVWMWYWVGGSFTGSPYEAKWLQAKAALLGGPPAAAMVAVARTSRTESGDEAALLEDFLQHVSLRGALQGK